jgi:hypothetical protein
MSGGFHADNCYKTDDGFQFSGTYYVRDPRNGWCYRMEPSASGRGKTSGTLVRRRISEELYEEALGNLLEAMTLPEGRKKAPPPSPPPEGRMPLLRYPPGKGPLYEWSKRWA